MPKNKIKVLVVDDSALIRAMLTDILNQDPRLTVVGVASDPFEARELIKKLMPDVLTLDIEMPKMNGITFLKNLMRLHPLPVVMISTLTQAGAPATLEALECGAVDFLGKPQGQSDIALENYRQQISEKVYWAAKANIGGFEPAQTKNANSKSSKVLSVGRGTLKPQFLCAIGASTGGTEAIKSIVQVMPANGPALVLTQHIPDVFSTSFAKRLDSCSEMQVFEAEHNQWIEQGCAYLAPGHSHLRIVKVGGKYQCKLDPSEPVNRHRPSVEVLFDSVTQAAGERAMGVLLTGMGADGAQALLRMRQAGCLTVAQDEESSVVWGMPGAAVKLDAATKILPLDRVAKFIISNAVV